MKLVLIEVMAATGVILFFTVTLSDFLTSIGFELPLLSIPIYILFVVAKILLTGYVVLQWLNEYYEITPDHVTHRKGIFFKHEQKIPLEHMKIVEVKQTLLGRIFNYGTISLIDPIHIERLDIYEIHNPLRYVRILEDQMPNEVEKIDITRQHILEPEGRIFSVH